ncbi:MAG: type II toxin-antitoxin system VapC family toxin [Planctomycetota bacterium]|nr:type II toxin-antitoxin system VapC family toxin [Planctomycetota bacterium]
MPRVYLETSFVSACVSNRTDAASIYRREASRDWWQAQGPRHELFVSLAVLAELSAPAYPMSREALDWVMNIPSLEIDEEVRGFAEILVRERVMPSPVAGDAIHVAVACVHDLDYLLSWNVRHLANPNKLTHLRTICVRVGYLPPRILTPDLLWEDPDELS